MKGKELMDAVSTVMAVVILVVIAALIVGTILGNTVFSELTIINTTAISLRLVIVTNLIAFVQYRYNRGVVWLVMYVKKLFDKKEGLQGISA